MPEPAATNRPYILMGEDNEFFAHLNRSRLEQAGLDVEVVGNGELVLESARKRKPDLILLDLIMPVKDGFTTIKELKADPALKDIKVVAFSSLEQPEDLEKLQQLGAAGFLVKTELGGEEIVARVKEYLN